MEDQDIQQANAYSTLVSNDSTEIVTVKDAKEPSSTVARGNDSVNPVESLPSVEPEPEQIVKNDESNRASLVSKENPAIATTAPLKKRPSSKMKNKKSVKFDNVAQDKPDITKRRKYPSVLDGNNRVLMKPKLNKTISSGLIQ